MSEIRDLLDHVGDLLEQREELKREVARLESELDANKETIYQRNRELAALQSERDELKRRVATLQTELAEQRAAMENGSELAYETVAKAAAWDAVRNRYERLKYKYITHCEVARQIARLDAAEEQSP